MDEIKFVRDAIVKLLKQWGSEHKGLCSYIREKQQGTSETAKREELESTAEADMLKACMNDINRVLHNE